MSSENDYTKFLKEAEYKKLLAEIDKINSEKKKTDIERAELEKPFFKRLKVIQTIIAGLVGGIAIIGLFNSIIEPTYKKDIIEKELEIAKSKKEIFIKNDSIEKSTLKIEYLKATNQRILDSLVIISKLNSKILLNNKSLLDSLKVRETLIIKDKQRTINIIKNEITRINSVKKGSILVGNVFFRLNKLTIDNNCLPVLQNIFNLLEKSKNIKISLSSDFNTNPSLSQQRLQVILNFFLSKGIERERILINGFGESELFPIVAENLEKDIQSQMDILNSKVMIYIIYN